jgi:hypothetical protein
LARVKALAIWERRLEREGLGTVSWGPSNLHEHDGKRAHLSAEARDASDVWMTWAREVGETFPFTSTRQRRIWSLYAEGIPLTQVNQTVGGSRRSITKAIRRVTLANPPPIPNPWRKSGRQLTPLRLVPREDDEDMPPTTTKPLLTYKSIKMRRGYAQTLPGNPREKDILLNVEGRPTPWGIDLVLDGGVVLSLPAWKIDHAIMVPEGA